MLHSKEHINRKKEKTSEKTRMIVQKYLYSISESQEIDILPYEEIWVEANHLLNGFKQNH